MAVAAAALALQMALRARLSGFQLIGTSSTDGAANAVLISALLLTRSERSPGITFHTEGGSQSSLLGALLVGSFTAAYVVIGFDGAAEMSEETPHPRLTAPRMILTAPSAAGQLGGCSPHPASRSADWRSTG